MRLAAFCTAVCGLLQCGWRRSAKVLINLWKTVWITVALSTHFGTGTGDGWISTGLLRENKQVFNSFMAKKDINLLILQSTAALLTNGVNA